MKNIQQIIIICICLLVSGCALGGKTKTNYGAQVELPQRGNYTSPGEIHVVPLPGQYKQELTIEELNKTYYVPYSELFTACLKAIRSMNLSLKTFNSTSGIIEFKTLQGNTYYLRLSPDSEFNSRSLIRLASPDGSRRIDKSFVDNIFNAINYQINKTQG
jgi:hypothetical protein